MEWRTQRETHAQKKKMDMQSLACFCAGEVKEEGEGDGDSSN